MSKSFLLMLCILIGLLVLACAKTDETNRNAATAGDAIGIPECDSFLTAYDTCVSTKVPEDRRAQFKATVATWRTQWKKLADNPQTRGTLANVCKMQLETARAQVQAFGCTL